MDELLQGDEYGLDLKSTVTAIEDEIEDTPTISTHQSDKELRDNPPAMQDLYDDLDEIVEAEPLSVDKNDKKDEWFDDELEAFFEQMERDEQEAAEQAKKRERMKQRYEERIEQDKWELERTAQKVFNPQSYLWKTPGSTMGAR